MLALTGFARHARHRAREIFPQELHTSGIVEIGAQGLAYLPLVWADTRHRAIARDDMGMPIARIPIGIGRMQGDCVW